MSSPEARIAVLEADLARNRANLAGSLTEISTRLKPANLVNAGLERVSGKAVAIAHEAVDAAKGHGGEAVLLGAGALLAFDIGRRSAKTSETPSADEALGSGIEEAAVSPPSSPGRADMFGAVENASITLKYWGSGLGAAALGYLLGKIAPVTETEKQLLGDVSGDLKTGVGAFWQEHNQGARQTAAQAFGVAKLAAAALGTMAALAQIMSSERPGRDRPA